jgi:rfaE bifunctional protein kinase chain/domain
MAEGNFSHFCFYIMTVQEINTLFDNFQNQKVLIIGDVMVDTYIWGKVSRISPEAPVPIVAISKRENRLGGAANVALNIKALGATPILCSVIGEGEKGTIFMDLLKDEKLDANGIVQSIARKTTVKTRVIGNYHQMLRVDDETISVLTEDEKQSLKSKIENYITTQNIDVVILEDYDKGVFSQEIIDFAVELANKKGIPTIVDPKKDNFLNFKEVTMFKPNLKELKEGLKIEFNENNFDELKAATAKLKSHLNIDAALITLSELGVYVSSEQGDTIIPAHKRDISDVSGAGDTVIAVASLCLASNTSHKFLASLANLSGGLVCEEVGVKPINKAKLLKEAQTLLS